MSKKLQDAIELLDADHRSAKAGTAGGPRGAARRSAGLGVGMKTAACALALVAALGLSACDKAVTGGNANAPGSPGTGNPTTTAAPAAPDTPAGGSTGAAGLAPHTNSSGGNAVLGTTGRGTTDPGGRSQSAQPGVGTAGGLGGSSGLGLTGSFPAGGASAAAAGQPGVAPTGSISNRK